MLNSDKLRAQPLPAFVTKKWFREQFYRFETPGMQKKVAEWLSQHYDNWSGDERDAAFIAKMMQDLAIPGFLLDLLVRAIPRAKKSSQKSKPPYITRRFFKYVYDVSPDGETLSEEDIAKLILQKLSREEDWENLRDMAFYSCVTHAIDDVLPFIRNTPAEALLSDFFADYGKKKKQYMRDVISESTETSLESWKSELKQVKKLLGKKSDFEPTQETVNKLAACEKIMAEAVYKYGRQSSSYEFNAVADKVVELLASLREGGENFDGDETIVNMEAILRDSDEEIAGHKSVADCVDALNHLNRLLEKEQETKRQIKEALQREKLNEVHDLAEQGKTLKNERVEAVVKVHAMLNKMLTEVEEQDGEDGQEEKLRRSWDKLEAQWGEGSEWKHSVALKIVNSIRNNEPTQVSRSKITFLAGKMGEAVVALEQQRESEQLQVFKEKIGGIMSALRPLAGEMEATEASPMAALMDELAAMQSRKKPPQANKWDVGLVDEEVERLLEALKKYREKLSEMEALVLKSAYDDIQMLKEEVEILASSRDKMANRVQEALHGKRLPPPDKAKTARVKPQISKKSPESEMPEGKSRPLKKAHHWRVVEKINSTVEAYLVKHEFEVAYLLAECGEGIMEGRDRDGLKYSSQVLECLAYPEKILESDFSEMSAGSDDGRSAMFAVAAFSAVFLRLPVRHALFHETGIFSGLCGDNSRLEEIRQLIERLGNHSPTVDEFIAADVFALADPYDMLAKWNEENHKKTFPFAPATYIWDKWTKQSGALGKVITALLEKHAVPTAKKFVTSARQGMAEALLEQEEEKMKGKKDRIKGTSREHLIEYFNSGVDAIDNTLQALAQQNDNEKVILCGKLRQAMQDYLSNAETDKPAVSACLNRGFGFFHKDSASVLFDGKVQTKPQGLKAYPQIPQDEKGFLTDYNWTVIEKAAKAIE